MAEALFLLRKLNLNSGDHLVNGIHSVITNDDNAQTAAQTIATVIGLLRTAGHPLPDNYFDERVLLDVLNAPGTGALGADGDYIAFLPRGQIEVRA